MRILCLNFDRGIPVLGDKGGSVHVRSVATALARLGHDVTLVCSRLGEGNAPPPVRLIELAPDAGPGPLAAEGARRGIPAERLTQEPLVRRELTVLAHDRTLSARVMAALAAADFRPDLIYERHALFHVAGIELAAACRVPRILEVNAPLAEEQERFRGLAMRDVAIACEARSWTETHLAVAVSDDVRRRILAVGADGQRVIVGPNGVDTALFRRSVVDGAAIRQQWNLGEDPVIGFIGSFKAWHGVDFLIDAVARLRTQGSPLRLLGVGTGPELEAARARAAACGLATAAVFTGAVPHAAIPAYLAAADLTIAPYRAQPDFYFSPLKIVESLAAGRPVVAPRIGQIESLIEDGVTGILYPPDDIDACVSAIRQLLDDPCLRGRLGATAAARATARWDWARLIDHVLAHAAALPRARAEQAEFHAPVPDAAA